MNHTSRSAVILLFVFNVKAQNNDYSQHSVRPIHPSLAVVFGVLSILFSITFLLLAYAKFCLATVYGESNDEEIIPQEILQPGSRFSGIDRKLVESLPFFKFSSLKGPKEGLECAICLSKFQDNETLRLMPKCRHSFHTNCIDKWLESHSSCPICRDRFEADDLTNFPCTNSLRYFANSFNQLEEQNVLFFVEREENRSHNTRSSRFNTMVGSLRRLSLGWIAEQLLQKDLDSNQSGNLLHKFRHRIIVSDLICKSRWSDLNSSDLTFLNSEMLNYLSSRRFSPVKSQSFHGQMRMDEDILNIKEDIERKRLFESRVGKITSDSAITAISPKILDSFVQDQEPSSSLLNPAEKRAMSEIVYLPRRTNCIARSRNTEPLSRNERIRRLWLPIARSTVQWYNGRESALDFKKSPINV